MLFLGYLQTSKLPDYLYPARLLFLEHVNRNRCQLKILLTGVAGFIGSAVCRKLVEHGHEVVGVDTFLPNLYNNEQKIKQWDSLMSLPGVNLIRHDLRNPLPEEHWHGVEAVINEAGMPGLMNSWSDFETYVSCNLLVVEMLAQQVMARKIKTFVQISTSSVYGNEAIGDEQSNTEPVSPYGVTKLAAEELLKAFERTHGLNFTVLRYFSVYGPGQRPDMAYNKIIDAVLSQKEISIFGDGQQTRTNTYIDDCAEATVAAAALPSTGEFINISGDQVISLNEAIKIIEKESGLKANLAYSPPRPGDQRHTNGNANKARKLLGLKSSVTMEEGLRRQVHWMREFKEGTWITPSPWDAKDSPPK